MEGEIGMENSGQPMNLSSTRKTIIRLLKEWGKGTATQLSKALGISRVAIYQHLDWLKKHGWVQTSIERKGRGRPAETFTLTEKAQEQFFPRRYDQLAFFALDKVASEFGEGVLLEIFRRYREKMVKGWGSVKGSLRDRIKALTEFLSSEGYFVRCDETENGFVLLFSNCPISQIARRFQQACISEEEILAKILGTKVISECRQASGAICCRYFIAKKSKGKETLKAV